MNQDQADQADRDESQPPAEASRQGQEELLWSGHPSRWNYFWRYLLVLLLVVGGVALAIWQRSQGAVIIAGLALAVVGLCLWLYLHLVRTRTVLTVTSRNVSFEQGLFSKNMIDLPIRSITEIKVEQSFGQRLLGMGLIGFSSSASEEIEIVCPGMPRPRRIRDLVRRHVDAE